MYYFRLQYNEHYQIYYTANMYCILLFVAVCTLICSIHDIIHIINNFHAGDNFALVHQIHTDIKVREYIFNPFYFAVKPTLSYYYIVIVTIIVAYH